MTPTLPSAVLLVAALAVASVGAVDSARSDRWDTVAVFGLLVVLLLLLLTRVRGRRPAVPIRADLVQWLRERSAVTGESVEALADRALAAHRDLYEDAPAAPGRGLEEPGASR